MGLAELLAPVSEVETFSKPGIADVTPSDLKKLSPLVKHYASMPHPFTSCYRDQIKHGLSSDHAKRRCSVIKQLGPRREVEDAEAFLKEVAEITGPAYVAEVALQEGKLSAAQRKKLPSSAFAIPGSREYPIHDEGHAKAALSMVSQHGSPAQKKRVRAAVKRRHPNLGKNMKEAEIQGVLEERIREAAAAVEVLQEVVSVPTVKQLNRATRYVTRQAKQSAASSSSSSSSSSSAHPRAPSGTPTGGQFITKGSVSSLAVPVVKALGVKGQDSFTRKDVRAYQRKNDLLVDGKIGAQTASSLLGKKVMDPGKLPSRLRKKLTASSSSSGS